jgi:uncharacterized protein
VVRPLLVNALELLRRPGSERQLVLVLPVGELGLHDPRLADGADVDVELRLESLTDGVVVDGWVKVPFHAECRRCLHPIDAVAVAEVHELHQVKLTDPDAFPIEHDQIDLEPMVREAVLLELPDAPVCRPDCAGLCPVCGIDRNVGSCECDATVRDPRWTALDELRSQLPDD